MTKRDQALMQATLDQALLLGALRWSSEVKPDVRAPDGEGYTEGWSFNVFSGAVEQGWSSKTTHGSGAAPKAGSRAMTASQGCQDLFSSEVRALEALRHALEVECAQRLLAVDRRLTKARGSAEGVEAAKQRG